MVISPKLYACTGCNLKTWKTVASKEGKKFDAMLKLEQDGKRTCEFEARK
ncbi:MAG: hypothetical protein ACRC7D_15345 [Aeromonas popoffii]